METIGRDTIFWGFLQGSYYLGYYIRVPYFWKLPDGSQDRGKPDAVASAFRLISGS